MHHARAEGLGEHGGGLGGDAVGWVSTLRTGLLCGIGVHIRADTGAVVLADDYRHNVFDGHAKGSHLLYRLGADAVYPTLDKGLVVGLVLQGRGRSEWGGGKKLR